jgi:hypothetical protein
VAERLPYLDGARKSRPNGRSAGDPSLRSNYFLPNILPAQIKSGMPVTTSATPTMMGCAREVETNHEAKPVSTIR